MIVVDTNVLVYAVRPGRFSEAALRAKAKDPDWVAPAFWRIEMANVLAVTMRVENLDFALALETFAMAESLVLDLGPRSSVEETLALAQSGSVSAYDAEFVLAAQHLDVPLVTADKRLIQAYPDLTIPLKAFTAEDA
jgi:predicted nucleic acid-binding protein